ncbi:MAG: hypothetical protein CL760_02090 [Chloroflexi bacterium]|nr:hypothetical protein [Chloroflexota bacterium]MQG05714.1 DUF3592 domain-containing protein [SAR202 cluster bacterium]|tara:strand:+ start:3871 stop:4371 length:501 start_codon:yes stop_codon:yes gene_type:complete
MRQMLLENNYVVWGLAVAISVVGIILLVMSTLEHSGFETVPGTITDFRYEYGGSGGDNYNPIVEFTTLGGEKIEFVSERIESQKRKSTGECFLNGCPVTIKYRPDDPKTYREIYYSNETWTLPIITFVVSGVILLLFLWAKFAPEIKNEEEYVPVIKKTDTEENSS